jgi:hypothetical protein
METEVKDIQRIVNSIPEDADYCELSISDNLTLDGQPVPQDVAMAIILDGLLTNDFFPDGFEIVPGGKKYKYKREV